MVRTRSQSKADDISSENLDATTKEIRAMARHLATKRASNLNPKSPSKMSKVQQKHKAKRESEKFEKLLSTMKKNLSQASNRALGDRPFVPKTLFEQIHDPILSGEAKRSLRPIIIDVD